MIPSAWGSAFPTPLEALPLPQLIFSYEFYWLMLLLHGSVLGAVVYYLVRRAR
jgi:hypothetical protein